MRTAQELHETYPDAIGWIYIPNTNINYPIMQGEDNDFYLTHGTDGRSLKCGCIELDFRKHGQVEWTPVAIIFGCLLFTLTAPLYIWNVVNI